MKLEYMQKALELAEFSRQDVPIAAVMVQNDKIISQAVNTREKEQQAINHAEILAIIRANKRLQNWRLNGCELYVTLEPCPMCASAIIQARISKVYFGAYDLINGAFGSKCDMKKIMNSNIEVKGGILEDECTKLIKNYFERIR